MGGGLGGGGLGGGGLGGSGTGTAGSAGTANSGGGGGGASRCTGSGGAGGSGTVLIKVPSPQGPTVSVSPPGSGSVTNFPGYTVVAFTASGELKRV